MFRHSPCPTNHASRCGVQRNTRWACVHGICLPLTPARPHELAWAKKKSSVSVFRGVGRGGAGARRHGRLGLSRTRARAPATNRHARTQMRVGRGMPAGRPRKTGGEKGPSPFFFPFAGLPSPSTRTHTCNKAPCRAGRADRSTPVLAAGTGARRAVQAMVAAGMFWTEMECGNGVGGARVARWMASLSLFPPSRLPRGARARSPRPHTHTSTTSTSSAHHLPLARRRPFFSLSFPCLPAQCRAPPPRSSTFLARPARRPSGRRSGRPTCSACSSGRVSGWGGVGRRGLLGLGARARLLSSFARRSDGGGGAGADEADCHGRRPPRHSPCHN